MCGRAVASHAEAFKCNHYARPKFPVLDTRSFPLVPFAAGMLENYGDERSRFLDNLATSVTRRNEGISSVVLQRLRRYLSVALLVAVSRRMMGVVLCSNARPRAAVDGSWSTGSSPNGSGVGPRRMPGFCSLSVVYVSRLPIVAPFFLLLRIATAESSIASLTPSPGKTTSVDWPLPSYFSVLGYVLFAILHNSCIQGSTSVCFFQDVVFLVLSQPQSLRSLVYVKRLVAMSLCDVSSGTLVSPTPDALFRLHFSVPPGPSSPSLSLPRRCVLPVHQALRHTW